MKIYDISMEIKPDMTVWKERAENRPTFTVMKDYDFNGRGNRETRVALGMHTGTHIDAPLHFLATGDSIEKTVLEELVRPVKVLDLTGVTTAISQEDLEKFSIDAHDFLLFKTINSENKAGFDFQFVYLDAGGAQYLAKKQISGVGIDALGIERAQADHATHKVLLTNSIIIIEGLDLKNIQPGEYFMVAAPLKIIGVEAAPARIFLLNSLD